jgi:hypothetical protein
VEPPDFNGWYEAITSSGEVDPNRAEPIRRWFLDLYLSQGPVTYEVSEAAFVLDQITLAEEAVAAVLADLHRTSDKRPHVVVDEYELSVRITVDGNYSTPSMMAFPFERAAAFAEVADYLQTEVVGNYGPVWPTCRSHDYGLHAEVHADRAEWWCRPNSHAVAAIGDLGM